MGLFRRLVSRLLGFFAKPKVRSELEELFEELEAETAKLVQTEIGR
jgi:hypothetical protein